MVSFPDNLQLPTGGHGGHGGRSEHGGHGGYGGQDRTGQD